MSKSKSSRNRAVEPEVKEEQDEVPVSDGEPAAKKHKQTERQTERDKTERDRETDRQRDKESVLPSPAEQRQLQQMAQLMRGNLLSLQAAELLAEARADKKLSSRKTADWTHALLDDLSTVLSASDSTSTSVSPEVVGSCVTHSGTAPLYVIDVAVTMPAILFSNRDLLNHGYFDKRALFLTELRKSLEQINKKVGERYKNFQTVLFKNDDRKPLLQFQPAFSNSVFVRIIPVAPEGVFKAIQLRPQKNNVRPDHWVKRLKELKASGKGSAELDKELKDLPGTPSYNNAILEDLTILLHHQIISKIITDCENVCDALILFKIWLTQRDLRLSPFGFDGHHAALLLAYLVQTKRITNQTPAVTTFQTLLSFLASSDMLNTVLDFSTVQLNGKTTDHVFAADATILQHPIQTDSSSNSLSYNAFWRVGSSSVKMLMSEAMRSLHELQNSKEVSTFHHLFMEKRGFFEVHDAFAHIAVPERWPLSIEGEELQLSKLHESVSCFALRKIEGILQKAFGDRVKAVNVVVRVPHPQKFGELNDHSYPTLSSSPSDEKQKLFIGVVFDKEKCNRKVERGPINKSATSSSSSRSHQQEVDAFKLFWGPKCQFRRFRDGTIVDSVVWDVSEAQGAKSIQLFESITRYILGVHLSFFCGSEGENIECFQSHLQMASIFPSLKQFRGPSTSVQAVEAFDSLRGIIVSKIRNLPINFDSIMAASPSLRYTALVPPSPHPFLLHLLTNDQQDSSEIREVLRPLAGDALSLIVSPLVIIAKFESSNKWPSDGDAIERCKNAFLLELRIELNKLDVFSVIHDGNIDIIHKGFVFKLIPFAGIETEKNVFRKNAQDSDGNLSAVAMAHREWTIPPLHHNAIKSIQSENPVFGEAVQLFRLWLAKHNFSGVLCNEAVELLVSQEFIRSSLVSSSPPTSAFAAFERTLGTLSNFDWDDDPFIIDFSGELTSDVKASINLRFRATRTAALHQALPLHANPPMYIVTSYDRINDFDPSLSAKSPERVILGMLVNAAKNTVKKIMHWLERPLEMLSESGEESESAAIVKSIFHSDAILKRCDHVLMFHKSLVNSQADKGPQFARLPVFANMTNKELLVTNLIVMNEDAEMNPVQSQLIEKIRDAFKEEALFFWDESIGNKLGVLLKPKFKSECDFAVLNTKYRLIPEDSTSLVQANIAELIDQIIRAGEGLLST